MSRERGAFQGWESMFLAIVVMVLLIALAFDVDDRFDDHESRLDRLEEPVVRSQANQPSRTTTTTPSVPSVKLCADGHVAETGPLEAANAPNAKRAKGAGCR